MKTKWHHSLIFGSAIGGLLPATPLFAADMGPGGYVGAGYGIIDVNDSDFDDDDTSGKLYVGGKFGKYIGVEASVNDFGEEGGNIARWELDGKTLSLVGYLPFNDRFALFAKAGSLWWDADIEVLNVEADFDGRENFGGLGVQFNFTDVFSMRAEYERYKVDLEADEVGVDVDSESDVNVASLGVQFNF